MKKNDFKIRVCHVVEKTLKTRHRHGTCESEADYLCGAMVVLAEVNKHFFKSTLDDSMDIVPVSWILSPMQGVSIIDRDEK